MVSLTPLLRPAALACLTAALCACSQDDGGSGSGDGARLYHLAGTVAVGRPGQWANVCIDDDCTRANNAGNYRLSLPLTQSELVRAAVPAENGNFTELTSLYRHSTNVSDVIVNLNPTTTALLEAWSRFSLGQTLDNCIDSQPGCARSLISSFTPGVEQQATEQLGEWLGNVWSPPRNPFSDPYLADPALDWLDDIHDHLHFTTTDAELEVTDNQGNPVDNLPYVNLFTSSDAATADSSKIADAMALPIPSPSGGNLIVIDMDVSPGATFNAPRTIRLDVSDSYSNATLPGNTLSFVQELVDPDGNVRRFNSSNLTTTVNRPGPHNWVVTVTDDANNRNTLGLVLQVGSDNPLANPTFGAAGSCPTDPLKMNINSVNFCEESLDGSRVYGTCEPVTSGPSQSIHSPARCSTTTQNGGSLLGVCTELPIELRVFYYVNPLSVSGESFSAHRSRLAQDCRSAGMSWSNQP